MGNSLAIRKGFLIKRGDGVFENIVEVTVKSSLLFIIWALSDFNMPFLIKGRRKKFICCKTFFSGGKRKKITLLAWGESIH